MTVDKYVARAALSGKRARDDISINAVLMMEVHEGTDGVARAYAIPSPSNGADDLVDEMVTTLPRAGIAVLTKRNEELLVENAMLTHVNKKLEEQNRELLDRLMRYADKALEVLHGGQDPVESGGGRSSEKKPRASKTAASGNGTEA